MKKLKHIPKQLLCLLFIFLFFVFIPDEIYSQTAIVSLPIMDEAEQDSILTAPIKVTTSSEIGIALFIVEYDSTKISFISATVGPDAKNHQMLLNTKLPFAPTSSQANKNVLISIYDPSISFFTGVDQNVVVLTFRVISAITDTVYLAFDRERTYLTTTELEDIQGSSLFFIDSNPLPQPAKIEVNIIPENSGSVTLNPDKVEYEHFEEVILTAIPSEGYGFNYWNGDVSGEDSMITVIMDCNKNVTAQFVLIAPKLTLGIDPVEGGVVIRNPDKTIYDPYEQVILKAKPSDGFRFERWSGNASGNDTVLTIIMDGNKSITAHFTLVVYKLTTSVYPPQGGTIIRNPDKADYLPNEEVTLSAVPGSGYQFVEWSGDASGTDSIATLNMDGDKNVRATFVPIAPTLTVHIEPANGGTVIKDPDKIEYETFEQVTLTAIPNEGFRFVYWSGDVWETASTITLIMGDFKNIWANFRQNTTPVTNLSLSAEVVENVVYLQWIDSNSLLDFKFEVERSEDKAHYISLGFARGATSQAAPGHYCFEDKNLPVGTYYYRIKQVDVSGDFQYSEPVEVSIVVPQNFQLSQNSPNPFNPETEIKYHLPKACHVDLSIYNVSGQKIRILTDEMKSAGYHYVTWDGSDMNGRTVASGIYFYTIQAGDFRITKKMVLMR